jgi:prevent-host-death family protein
MSRTVGIREAKQSLSRLVAEIEATGGEIVLTRRGKPVAKIVKIAPAAAPAGRGKRIGLMKDHPALANFTIDPDVFAPLLTDEDLRREGYDV